MSKKSKRKLKNKRRRARRQEKKIRELEKAVKEAKEQAKGAPALASFGHQISVSPSTITFPDPLTPEEEVRLKQLQEERKERTHQKKCEMFAALEKDIREEILYEYRRKEIADTINVIGAAEAEPTQEESDLKSRQGLIFTGIGNTVWHTPIGPFIDWDKLPEHKVLQDIHAQAEIEELLGDKR